MSVPAGGVCLGNVYRDGLMCVSLYVSCMAVVYGGAR